MSTAVPVIEIPSFYVVDSVAMRLQYNRCDDCNKVLGNEIDDVCNDCQGKRTPVKEIPEFPVPVIEIPEFRNYCVECHVQIGDTDVTCEQCSTLKEAASVPEPADYVGPKSVLDAFENYEGYYRIGSVLGSFAIALAILMHGLMSVNPQCTMPQQRHYRAQPF